MGKAEYDVVCRFAEAFGSHDFDAAAALLHEEVVFVEPAGLPYAGEWHGVEGIAALAQALLTEWDYGLVELSVHDAGERVLILARVEFTSTQSGAKATVPVAEIYTVRDGKIVENSIFYQDIPALSVLHAAVPPAR